MKTTLYLLSIFLLANIVLAADTKDDKKYVDIFDPNYHEEEVKDEITHVDSEDQQAQVRDEEDPNFDIKPLIDEQANSTNSTDQVVPQIDNSNSSDGN